MIAVEKPRKRTKYRCMWYDGSNKAQVEHYILNGQKDIRLFRKNVYLCVKEGDDPFFHSFALTQKEFFDRFRILSPANFLLGDKIEYVDPPKLNANRRGRKGEVVGVYQDQVCIKLNYVKDPIWVYHKQISYIGA